MQPLTLVKIADNLSSSEHISTAERIALYGIDGIELSINGGRWGPTWRADNYNLDFLRFYIGIKALRIFLPGIKDLSSITCLRDTLQHLQLGELHNKKTSLEFIGELTHLKTLSTVRNSSRLEVISKLNNLEGLALTGYQLEKLEYIGTLNQLKKMHIGFGTSKNLDKIGELQNLEELDILWIKTLSDITAISKLVKLQKLKIEYESQIKVLPDISKLKYLKNIRLMNLNQLEDISSIKESFAEEFIITGPNENSDIILPLTEAGSIKRVYTYFYNKKEQDKAEVILGDKFTTTDMHYEMNHIKSMTIKYLDIKTGKEIS